MLIIDNFLADYDALRDYADVAVFEDVINPIDGVTYPLICADIPDPIKFSILARLADFKGSEPEQVTLFMRRSPAGVPVPNGVHSDKSMGRYSLILYLNRIEDCRGGTSFLSHRASGIAYNPELSEFVDIILRDHNDHESWDMRELVTMLPNRALIFDASRLHRAEPVGGFGSTSQDARLVLTCFFS